MGGRTIWHRTITPKLNFCPKCCQKCSIKFNLIISNVWCQIVLVPNCPVPNCLGAKLSGWQIVHFYYSGAKLSVFIILVPNCLFLLSWCQVVRFIILEPNCPVLNCLVPNCPLYYLGAKLSSAKLSGAKLSALLSWCQIVRCQIVWCQIVLQSLFGLQEHFECLDGR